MTNDDLHALLDMLRSGANEDNAIEIKSAAQGLPKSLRSTVSAFANSVGGGVILLGVDEAAGFAVVGVGDAGRCEQALHSMCSDEFEPPVRARISVHGIGGVAVIVAEVPELDHRRKPCFYRGAGVVNGSYVRVGSSDRRLSPYEVQLLLAGRGQPRDDLDIVPGATVGDLDSLATELLVRRLRGRGPHFLVASNDEVLQSVGAVADGQPTNAGLLALGRFPRTFLPQVNLTFVAYPSADGAPMEDGTRFLDNESIDGSIPAIVDRALVVVRRNMTRRSVIDGRGRRDIWEYPEAALREAVVNALMHRDLSPWSRGTQVRVEMFPDRLVVDNPGGIFGPPFGASGDDRPASSPRNAVLARLLEDVTTADGRAVAENRGSGIRAMRHAMSDAGLPAPEFAATPSMFTVTLRQPPPTADRTTPSAGREDDRRAAILTLMGTGELSARDAGAHLGISRQAALRWLKLMQADGLVEPTTENLRSPRLAWRRVTGS